MTAMVLVTSASVLQLPLLVGVGISWLVLWLVGRYAFKASATALLLVMLASGLATGAKLYAAGDPMIPICSCWWGCGGCR